METLLNLIFRLMKIAGILFLIELPFIVFIPAIREVFFTLFAAFFFNPFGYFSMGCAAIFAVIVTVVYLLERVKQLKRVKQPGQYLGYQDWMKK